MATVSTTFTFSSTDISSDALSFTVSENLSLTGSGGVVRFNLAAKYTGSMEDPNFYGTRKGTNAYEIYAGSGSSNDNNPSGSVPTYLYLKNVTGSGFSASAGGISTASCVHIFVSGAGSGATTANDGAHDVAKIYQGGFAYIPINPNVSYYAYSPTGSGGAGLTGTIIEYGVFR
jgi:hypothetical protein|tara:strand:- start:195 stop:716 length:522 start_codon:yes stop_codon:yes gene_type:complete